MGGIGDGYNTQPSAPVPRHLPIHASRSTPLALGARLDALVAGTDVRERRDDDPVSFVHRFTRPDDQEVVGLVAALLAFGNVKAIRRSIARVLDVLGSSPSATIARASEGELARALETFAHRVYRGADVARVLARAGELRAAHGSIGRAFHRMSQRADVVVPPSLETRAALVRGLAGLGDALRDGPPTYPRGRSGLPHLVPDVRKGSACKRLLLYLRWMCRPSDGVDLGLFPFPAAELVIPLDTHVHRISRNLGLTRRRDASLRTAIEITDALARFDATDPVKYDFAICHLGVSRQCPSRRDESLCGRCVIRDACRHWAREGARPQPRRRSSLEARPRISSEAWSGPAPSE